MNKRLLIALLVLSVLTAAIVLFWPSDESRIRKLFKKGAAAVESRELEKVMAKVSFNYRDDYGMTYLYLREALKRDFQRFSDISIEYENLMIQVSGDRATAEMDLRVIATSGNETGYIVGDIRSPVHLRFTLGKERTKWLIEKTEGFEGSYDTRKPVR